MSVLVARTATHARVLYPMLKGTTVCDTLVWDGPETLESFLDTFVDQPGDPSHRHFTILGGGIPVGALSIRPGFQPPRGDLGYWVGIPHQGKGYATAAVGEALRIAFADMGMEKIEACAFVGNFASRRVLEKCGFQQEGLTRKAVLKRGRWLDEWVFGLTRERWEALKLRTPATRRLHLDLKVRRTKGYSTPEGALAAAGAFDSRWNRVPIGRLRDRPIRAVAWSDSALTLALGDSQFLNLRARADEAPCPVDCTLDEDPLVPPVPANREEVVYASDKREWETSRTEIAGLLLGDSIYKAHLEPDGVLLYLNRREILSCHRIARAGGGEPVLYWGWTE